MLVADSAVVLLITILNSWSPSNSVSVIIETCVQAVLLDEPTGKSTVNCPGTKKSSGRAVDNLSSNCASLMAVSTNATTHLLCLQ